MENRSSWCVEGLCSLNRLIQDRSCRVYTQRFHCIVHSINTVSNLQRAVQRPCCFFGKTLVKKTSVTVTSSITSLHHHPRYSHSAHIKTDYDSKRPTVQIWHQVFAVGCLFVPDSLVLSGIAGWVWFWQRRGWGAAGPLGRLRAGLEDYYANLASLLHVPHSQIT